ncbi:RNA polymerase sigma factor, sigma-70 family [bacterium A37T11]|nr:RNA polymerase sigma factor, sigma-70 family [bacterium A37T11]
MDLNSCWSIFINGDKAAFQQLYEQTSDELFAYGIGISNDREIVLDSIHDLFVDLYGNKKISREVNVKHYLFASLRRRILAANKSHFESFGDGDESLDNTDSRETEIILDETEKMISSRLMAEVSQLPKRQREVLHLRYTMDLSYAEISSVMEINIETCRTLCHRAVKVLRANLKLMKLMAILVFYYFS